MKKSYTNIAEVCVIAGLCLGITVSFFAMFEGDNSIIRVLGFAGIFVSIILCAVFGTIVEISLNIAKCGEMLDKLVKNQQNENSPASEANNLANPTPADLPKKNDDFWKCPDCGTKNENFRYICQRCGRNR